MNESDAVALVLSTIESVTSLPVFTSGGQSDAAVPSIVIDGWEANRLRYRNGARNYVRPVVDGSGTEIGRLSNIYYEATFDVVGRHTDEVARDDLLKTIRDSFILFEDDPTGFHADVQDVTVGNVGPRALLFREPDWYQAGLEISFVFVDPVTQDWDALQAINETIDPS